MPQDGTFERQHDGIVTPATSAKVVAFSPYALAMSRSGPLGPESARPRSRRPRKFARVRDRVGVVAAPYGSLFSWCHDQAEAVPARSGPADGDAQKHAAVRPYRRIEARAVPRAPAFDLPSLPVGFASDGWNRTDRGGELTDTRCLRARGPRQLRPRSRPRPLRLREPVGRAAGSSRRGSSLSRSAEHTVNETTPNAKDDM